MSNGPAKTSKSLIDEIKQLKKDKAKGFGLDRMARSVSPAKSLGQTGSRGNSDSGGGGSSDALRTEGGTMVGPIAFFPKSSTIVSGVLDISNSTSGSYSSRIIVLGAGAAADDLDTITGAAHAGQILFLQAVTTTPITLKHLTAVTGNIWSPTLADYIITDKEIVVLQWDTTNEAFSGSGGQWSCVANFTDGSGGSGMQNPATADLNMATYDITNVDNLKFDITGQELTNDTDGIDMLLPTGDDFDILINGTREFTLSATTLDIAGNNMTGIGNMTFDVAGQSLTSSTGGHLWQIPASDTYDFYVNLASKFKIAETVIDMGVATLDFNGSQGFLTGIDSLIFRNSINDNITSSVDGITYNVNSTDEHFFKVGGTLIFTIDSGSMTAAKSLLMGNNAISGISTLGFDATSSTSFLAGTTTEIGYYVPSGDIHRFYVAGTRIGDFDDDGLDLNVNARIDFGGNAISLTASSGFQSLPGNPVAFINIKVGGADYRVPYYAT